MLSPGPSRAFSPLLVLPCGPMSPNLVSCLLPDPSRTPGFLYHAPRAWHKVGARYRFAELLLSGSPAHWHSAMRNLAQCAALALLQPLPLGVGECGPCAGPWRSRLGFKGRQTFREDVLQPTRPLVWASLGAVLCHLLEGSEGKRLLWVGPTGPTGCSARPTPPALLWPGPSS